MRNIKLLLEFDGTDFGWQRQPGSRTVQGVMEAAVEAVFRTKANVVGAGRTDAGVHAFAYVCNFEIDTDLDVERIAAALSANLPEDIIIQAVSEARPGFHSRFDAISRRYVYHISTEKTAVWRRVFHSTKYTLDVDAMSEAIQALRGEHDFSSFTQATNETTRICNVLDVGVNAQDSLITISIEANRFLHNMVRVIVGTLIEIGRGKISPEQMGAILGKKDRAAAGPTVPPGGLSLVEVCYPEE